MATEPSVTAAQRQRRVETSLRLEPILNPRADGDVTIAEAMQRWQIPGASVAVIEGGEIAWAQGFGVVQADGTTPVAPDTIFQACSISKAVAAVAAMRLVQQRRLRLDDDVNDALTSWRIPANDAWQPRVTLRQLLSHTAGLTYCWYPGYRRGEPTPTLLQTLEGQPPANTPPVRVTGLPGVRFRYSGSHFSVLQQLLVDIAGQSFQALMRELVFEPLAMRHSSYDPDFPAAHIGATAAGHDAGGRPIDGGWRVQQEAAGAGLWTTPADLARLALEVQAAWAGRSSRLLDQPTARRMLAPQVGGRGLGWSLEDDNRRFGHGGDNIGYKCRLVAAVEGGWGIAAMTNGDEGSRLVDAIVRAAGRVGGWPGFGLADALGIAGQDDASGPALDPAYTGEYQLDGQIRLTVIAAPAGLLLRLPDQAEIPLAHLSGATFTAEVVDAAVTFTRTESGEASGLTLRQHGEAAFAEKIA